ncbi:transposase [Acetobacter sp. AC2005]|uniref:transposase n=1 Tax=Acetobacter sp. AC2005 TaxID=3134142 RepID=UPI0038D0C984
MRGDLTDKEWTIISNLLPERSHWFQLAQDNRLFLNGMLCVLRVGCPWRHTWMMRPRVGNLLFL